MKRAIFVVLFACATLSMAACNSGEVIDNVSAAEPPAAPQTSDLLPPAPSRQPLHNVKQKLPPYRHPHAVQHARRKHR